VISLTSGPRVEFDDDTHELDDRLLIIKVDIQKRRIFLNACINNVSRVSKKLNAICLGIRKRRNYQA
jgi:hypothetical protein